VALCGLDLSLYEGQITALLGKNGTYIDRWMDGWMVG